MEVQKCLIHYVLRWTAAQRVKNTNCIAPDAILSLCGQSGFGGDIVILTCQAQAGISRPRPQSGRSHINSEPLLKFFLDTTVIIHIYLVACQPFSFLHDIATEKV